MMGAGCRLLRRSACTGVGSASSDCGPVASCRRAGRSGESPTADARQRDAGATNPARAQASAAPGGCGKVAERIEARGAARSARGPDAVPGSGSRTPLEFDWERQAGTALQEPGDRRCGIPARKDSEVVEGGCMARVRSTALQPMT